jgi:hypothetical protein
MAVDEHLAERVRAVLGRRRDLAEKRMFGGLCFLLNGNMLCCAEARRMLFRVGKDQHAAALKRPGARPMEMNGRRMEGFVFVDPAGYEGRGLKSWIEFAESYVGTLEPKKAAKIRTPRTKSRP